MTKAEAMQKVLLRAFAEVDMTEAEAAAQAALRGIVVALEEIHKRLEDVHSHLAAPSGEAAKPVNVKGMRLADEFRSAIESALADRIGPAIRDLAAAVTGPRMKDFQLSGSD